MKEGNPIAKTVDLWFAPKPFESTQLYERLGVKTFKKYMPLTGDLMNRYVWSRVLTRFIPEYHDVNILKQVEFFTRVYEGIHLTGGIIGTIILAHFLHADLVKDATVITAWNTLINIYPVMVQRYNRIRLLHAANRMSELSAKNSNL